MNFRILNSGLADSGYLPRGSRLSWRGTVTSDVFPSGNPFSREPNKELTALLAGQGFGINEVTWASRDLGVFTSDFEIIVTVTTPIDYARADDAFSVINGDVWTVYGQQPRNVSASVLNRPYVDQKTGNTYYTASPVIGTAADAQVTNPNNPNRCADKYGLQWIACQTGLDSTAQQLGFGIGAGVALLVVGGVVLLMILKK